MKWNSGYINFYLLLPQQASLKNSRFIIAFCKTLLVLIRSLVDTSNRLSVKAIAESMSFNCSNHVKNGNLICALVPALSIALQAHVFTMVLMWPKS